MGGNFTMNSYGIAMGGKIYSLRVAKRMTQEQLAQELCVSPAAVSKWERNQAIPNIEMLWALADFFECTIDELVGRNTALLERVGVYDSEKLKSVETAGELLNCAEIARQRGLLAMEKKFSTCYQGSCRFLPFAVKFSIQCLTKQMDPELIGELLENYAAALPEKEQTVGKMIADVLPRIISGENLEALWEITASYIGMEYRVKIKPMTEEGYQTSEEIWEKLQKKEPYSASTVLLEPLTDVDNFKICTILRNIDNETLAAAMYGASGNVVRRFFENISYPLMCFTYEDMEHWTGTEKEILAAQRKVLELGAWAE